MGHVAGRVAVITRRIEERMGIAMVLVCNAWGSYARKLPARVPESDLELHDPYVLQLAHG